MVRKSVAVAIALLAMIGGAATTSPAQNASRIVQPVDESQRITLHGNVRPEATDANDRGRVADDLPLAHMLLQLQRSPDQEATVRSYVDSLYTAKSSDYHHWLSAQEYGSRFGVSPDDLIQVTSWLGSHGFIVNQVYPNGMVIDFSGTAGQIREAFHTEIHNLDVNGVAHIANMSDAQIPAAFAPVVAGVVSMHDFRPHHSARPRSDYTFASNGAQYAVVPGDMAVIYNFDTTFHAGISGQGQTIVLFEDTNLYTTDDWTTFRNTFGFSILPPGTLTQIHPGSNCTNPGNVIEDEFEAILDAEWASLGAPSANIVLASCADTRTTFGALIAIENMINESNPPKIFSLSYGECEAENGAAANAAYYTAFQQASAEGISVFVAAGDWGADVCDAGGSETVATHGVGVNAYASTPYNVAVGGTDFGDTYLSENSTYWSSTNSSSLPYTSALSYIPEIPWNDSCASLLVVKYYTGSVGAYGSLAPYGSSGFCNTSTGRQFLSIIASSGGPSGCATGSPSDTGVVSGSCDGYAKPSWQSVLGNPADGMRDLPDVSMFAADGLWGHYYVVCYSRVSGGGAPCTGAPSTWAGGGGTSFATPIMAGIQALVNQKMGAPQGLPTPVYYALANAQYNASTSKCLIMYSGANPGAQGCVFNDLWAGNITVDCRGQYDCYLPSGSYGALSTSDSTYEQAYMTGTGWDFASGLGSVNVTALVNAWSTVAPP